LFQNVTLLEFHIKNVEISFISSNIKEEYTISMKMLVKAFRDLRMPHLY
jgi:hypothetical protein